MRSACQKTWRTFSAESSAARNGGIRRQFLRPLRGPQGRLTTAPWQNRTSPAGGTPPAMRAGASGRASTGREFLDGFSGQRLTADTPLAARNFGNLYPGHAAHVFAFDGNHRVRQFLDDLLLLLGVEDFLDQMDLDQWHCSAPRFGLVRARLATRMHLAVHESFQSPMIYSCGGHEMLARHA